MIIVSHVILVASEEMNINETMALNGRPQKYHL